MSTAPVDWITPCPEHAEHWSRCLIAIETIDWIPKVEKQRRKWAAYRSELMGCEACKAGTLATGVIHAQRYGRMKVKPPMCPTYSETDPELTASQWEERRQWWYAAAGVKL